MTTMGRGKEMRRVPCTPRDSKTMSHTVERCRCRPSCPGGTFLVQAGSGCLGARVTQPRGVSVWASPKSSRDGMGTTTSRATTPAPVLASLPAPAERPERREPSPRAMPASLGARPAPVPPGQLPCSSGNRPRGWYLRRARCRMSGDHAKNRTYRLGEVCKAQIKKGGADMKQCNNKTKNLDEIHRNSYEFDKNTYEIRTSFVRISYEFHIASIFTQIHSREMRAKFVRISYEHLNFVQFSTKQSKHTRKHTLHSHGHVIAHAPDFVHLSDRHVGAVFARCHSVVGRSGGAMPVMA